MDEFAAWLWDVSFWHWWGLAIILIAIEVFAASTFLLWPAFAAVAVGIVVAFVPDLDWRLQLFGFALLAAIATVSGRMLWQRYRGETGEPNLNRRGSQFIGRRITLSEALPNGSGRVRIDDSSWPVRSEDGRPVESGQTVEIVAVDGIELRVKVT